MKELKAATRVKKSSSDELSTPVCDCLKGYNETVCLSKTTSYIYIYRERERECKDR